MDSINYSQQSICDANHRKWACSLCTYLNWSRAIRCTQCETLRDKNLNNLNGSPISTDLDRRLNSRDRLTDIFQGLKLSELSSPESKSTNENNRIGFLNNDSSPPHFQYAPPQHPPEQYFYGGAGMAPPMKVIDTNKSQDVDSKISPLICQSTEPNQSAFNFNTTESDYINSSTYGAIGSNKGFLQNSTQNEIGGEECEIFQGHNSRTSNSEKWSCVACTYDNWPRAIKCVMCLTPRGKSTCVHRVSSPEDMDQSPYVTQGNNRLALNNQVTNSANNRITTAGTKIMSHGPGPLLVSNNRRAIELDRKWLEACIGVVDGNISPVEIYLAAGGNPSRQLTQAEVSILARPSAFDVGLTLIHLALRFQQENLLATLLSQVDGSPAIVKRVPSYAAPDLAMEVRRHVKSVTRQRKGGFRCHFSSEIATFTLPSEIEDYPSDLQETVFDEVLDRDVQNELDKGLIINWSTEILEQLNSRLYALWNRSAGDCLLDSVLQATWGIFDQDNGLRQALSDSLQECATMFYQRWKDNELLHAHLLDFSLNDSQCAADWAKLLSIASKPGSSLEQLHIFVLAHILRRPIIVYGVKFVKSFRGETLGYARYEGLYLPFFWEVGFCYKSPICLGYTRGHFSALVTIEPDCDPMSASTSAAQFVPPNMGTRCSYLPLTSVDGNLLPIHFLTQSELGKEEMIMNQWLDVRFTDTGIMVACQQSQTPSVLVGQMMEEWLNHYRRLGQLTGGTFLRQAPAPCYSSDGESDE